MNEFEKMPTPEKPLSGIERLRNIRQRLEERKKEIDTSIDELMKNLGKVIAAAEEDSIRQGRQDDVINEMLESEGIISQVHQLREASDRLRNFIEELSKATDK